MIIRIEDRQDYVELEVFLQTMQFDSDSWTSEQRQAFLNDRDPIRLRKYPNAGIRFYKVAEAFVRSTEHCWPDDMRVIPASEEHKQTYDITWQVGPIELKFALHALPVYPDLIELWTSILREASLIATIAVEPNLFQRRRGD